MSSRGKETVDNDVNEATRTDRPYRWGIFQSIVFVPAGIVTLVAAYNSRPPFRVINLIAAVLYFVGCNGLANKRRYGMVLYYVLAAVVCGNYARIVTILLTKKHVRAHWPLPPSIFLLVTIFIACSWIVPAIVYYPKRWNEFS